jgi:hypothetical protein
VQAELERGDHPEVAAPSTQRPEEVLVLVSARPNLASVGEDDLGRDKVVDRHPVAAALVGHAATQRQPRDPGLGDDPARGGEAVGRGDVVDIGPGRAALYVDGAPRLADPDRSHGGEIDHDAVVD